MSGEEWAKKYAAMDQRLLLKYEQLPQGEQVGKKVPASGPAARNEPSGEATASATR